MIEAALNISFHLGVATTWLSAMVDTGAEVTMTRADAITDELGQKR